MPANVRLRVASAMLPGTLFDEIRADRGSSDGALSHANHVKSTTLRNANCDSSAQFAIRLKSSGQTKVYASGFSERPELDLTCNCHAGNYNVL